MDEADSIFIDEARTPLIIANPTRLAEPEEQVVYHWADELARQMKRDEHFTLDLKKDKIELTDAGRQLVRYSNPPTGEHARRWTSCSRRSRTALHAHYRFLRDQHYMIDNEKKIVIIDEGTGRPMPDRHWRDGLHQAVEAKERVPINMRQRPRGPDHLPELLPAVHEARRHERHAAAELLGAAEGVQAVDDAGADEQADHPRRRCRTACSRPRTRSSTPWSQKMQRDARRPAGRC